MGYPAQVLQQPVPEEAAPIVRAMIGIVFGPLLVQVGKYMRTAGYFIGSLFSPCCSCGLFCRDYVEHKASIIRLKVSSIKL
jgi:hypothetical protein